ncbi:MAG: toll/interleukin-1 receptor domain-containing protein [bacterium]
MPYDCFISYALEDVNIAEEVYEMLTTQKLNVWFDKERLQPGFNWQLYTEEAYSNSRIIIPILTPLWKDCNWCLMEIEKARDVVPLIFEGEWENIITPPLEKFRAERIDFSYPDEQNKKYLFQAIYRLLWDYRKKDKFDFEICSHRRHTSLFQQPITPKRMRQLLLFGIELKIAELLIRISDWFDSIKSLLRLQPKSLAD